MFDRLLISWIAKHARNSNPVELSGDRGRITPGKTLAIITIVFGLSVAISGIFLASLGGEHSLGFGIFILGICIGGFMAPSFFSFHDVTWDENSITGICRLFGPTLGLRRTTIEWSDVASRGQTATQYNYLQSIDGRRVYWSYLYHGNGELERIIAERCKSGAI
ncbi:hypothetical protein [Robiginitomaculum antarcticum]|uniref:hypothetical protein n=1 Tax=Robiginitomaculum antarcticum TaxID=437507 RepID=UPI0012EA2CC5|nr:hypothetical protein [Robiginitomaculum antarcticum]